MSAPSKEEIAVRVATARRRIGRNSTEPVIVALADEIERLRAEQQRPMPWTEDEVKSLIKEAVESDPNGKCIHCGGTFPKTDLYHWRDCLRHTANIEIAKLRAERAELRAIFPDTIATPDDDCAEDDDPTCAKCGQTVNVDDGCEWDRGDVCHHCAQEAFTKARVLLRGQP